MAVRRYPTRFASGRKSSVKPTEWTVQNFKSVEFASLPLEHLTILTGPNSSGKSSLIQSLLMVAQSSDGQIVLNGELVRLGEGLDVIRTGSNRITLSYSVTGPALSNDKASEWSFSLELGIKKTSSTALELLEFNAAADGEHILTASSRRVSASIREELNSHYYTGNDILRVSEVFGRPAPPRTYLTFEGLFPEELLIRNRKDKILSQLRGSFNIRALKGDGEKLFQLYQELDPWLNDPGTQLPDEVEALYKRVFMSSTNPISIVGQIDANVLDKLLLLYSEKIERDGWTTVPVMHFSASNFRSRLNRRGQIIIPDEFIRALPGLSYAGDGLRAIHDSIKYLGPLRVEPQVVSASGARSRALPAGAKGEFTADLLVREKDTLVTFFDWDGNKHEATLPTAVSIWTTYLGVGEQVRVEDQGKLGRGLRLSVQGVERDLTTVGVGASQLLPVIALVLAAKRSDIICIEQPELHLHPAVQSRLADFFLRARPDITLILETHSEYMITRIRRRAAEGATSAGKVSVFFAEQHKGVTSFRNLRLTSHGDFHDWPEGFFDNQDEDARALIRALRHARLDGVN